MPAHDSVWRWVRRWWRPLAAEAVATALLVALGCMSLLPTPKVAAVADRGAVVALEHPPLAHAALGFGFVIVALVQVFGGVSGAHMNPAVTLAALLAGEMRASVAAAYAVAQCVGAAAGFGALLAVVSAPAAALHVGCTAPAPHVSSLAAAGVEATMTGLLALLCCSAWRPPSPPGVRPPSPPPHDPAMPVKFGLLVAGLVYAGGPLTGTSLNPARSLAPALWYNSWTAHWVYWAGPLVGAAAAALLYFYVLVPRPSHPATPDSLPTPAAPQDELLPLRDKPAV